MSGSEIHRCTQALRLHLLDMCRVCQKCVDYSMKALQSGRQDFSTAVLDNAYEIGLLRNDANEIAWDLMLADLASASDVRFLLACVRISDALQGIQECAHKIAEDSQFLWSDEEIECAELKATGDLANRLMRLCTVAIFEEEIVHAQLALQAEADWRRQFDQTQLSHAAYVLSMSERLHELIRHTREIARAIVFWLEDNKRESSTELDRLQPSEFYAASPQTLMEY